MYYKLMSAQQKLQFQSNTKRFTLTFPLFIILTLFSDYKKTGTC